MDYQTEIQKLLEKGESILVLAEDDKIKNVEGLNKFKRKVKKEILFLKSVITY